MPEETGRVTANELVWDHETEQNVRKITVAVSAESLEPGEFGPGARAVLKQKETDDDA